MTAPNSKVFQELLLVHGPSVGDTMTALGELLCSLGFLEAAYLSDSSCWFPVVMARDHSPDNCTNLQTPQVLCGLRAHPEHHPRRQPPVGPLQCTLLAAVRNKLSKNHLSHQFSSVQFSSVAQSCPTLCDPMNRSTPGLPVHHQLPGFTQTHVHQVCDAIQPSHPLSSPSPPAPNPSQHQSLFQ